MPLPELRSARSLGCLTSCLMLGHVGHGLVCVTAHGSASRLSISLVGEGVGDTPSVPVGVLCSFHSGLFTGVAQATLTLAPGCRPEPCAVGLMGGSHPSRSCRLAPARPPSASLERTLLAHS